MKCRQYGPALICFLEEWCFPVGSFDRIFLFTPIPNREQTGVIQDGVLPDARTDEAAVVPQLGIGGA